MENKKDFSSAETLLRVEHLCQYFKMGKGELKAVDDVNFDIKKGEVFGLVGESGCGKTTTGRSIIGLYNITSGKVYFKDKLICLGTSGYSARIKEERKKVAAEIKELKKELSADPSRREDVDKAIKEKEDALAEFTAKEKDELYEALAERQHAEREYAFSEMQKVEDKFAPLLEEARNSGDEKKYAELKKQYAHDLRVASKKRLSTQIQMIFQDPIASLDPRMTVREIISEGLVINGVKDKKYIEEKVYEVLETVGLVREHAGRYPHEFSGGQRQRIGIARAVIMQPEMIIADEPISALDVSIQAQVINLLNDLRDKFGLTILFIAHDLSVVKYFSDRIGVMYFGKMVELASSDELFAHPLHPYTKSLLSAIPLPDPHYEKKRVRMIYNPMAEHDYSEDKPSMREVSPKHFVYCNDKEFENYRKILSEQTSL